MKKSKQAGGTGNSGTHRSGVAAIAGRTNVGKSTLLNRILGQKLSIVSPKAQTTRQQVLAILTRPGFQVVFADTPGVMKPGSPLQEHMIKASFRALSGADLSLLIVEATLERHPDDSLLLEHLKLFKGPRILAINKIDLVPKEYLLPQIDSYHRGGLFEAIVPVSALKGEGVEALVGEIVRHLPAGPALYAEDQVAVQPLRFFASELIRETLYELLREELPYATAVKIDEYREQSGRKTYILALIYTERDSQKGIIIGRKGETLKRIGEVARKKIEKLAGEPVYLELRVKVKEKWSRNESFLNMVGYTRDS
ncbi:MAG: GTPase Era [Candidatus Glassbacteria bacterium]|nr:GTPase Era [Candidatus Glassbacteria bacterium]